MGVALRMPVLPIFSHMQANLMRCLRMGGVGGWETKAVQTFLGLTALAQVARQKAALGKRATLRILARLARRL